MIGFKQEVNEGKLSKFGKALYIAVVAATLAASVYFPIEARAQDISVYHSPSIYDAPNVVYTQKRAGWIWSERLGIDIQYQGDTTASCLLTDGVVTSRTLSPAEWAANNVPSYFSAFTGTCSGQPFPYDHQGFIGAFKPDTPAQTTLAAHELGHGMGAWDHSSDKYDLVSYNQVAELLHTVPPKSVGIDDINSVIAGNHFNLTYNPSYCFVEWLENGDLFATDFMGRQVYLTRLEDVNGYMTWKQLYSVTNTSVGCSGDYSGADGTIYLFDVRAPDANFNTVSYWARLQFMGAQTWRLVAGGTNP